MVAVVVVFAEFVAVVVVVVAEFVAVTFPENCGDLTDVTQI